MSYRYLVPSHWPMFRRKVLSAVHKKEKIMLLVCTRGYYVPWSARHFTDQQFLDAEVRAVHSEATQDVTQYVLAYGTWYTKYIALASIIRK
jgi:predicted deacetylase